MKTETQRNIQLGALVLIGTVLLVLGIYMVGKRQNLFSRTFQVRAVFATVNGLQPGNGVRFLGINIGTVDDVSVLNDTAVNVTLEIRDEVKSYLRSNAIATIGSEGLMGDMVVNILPGSVPGAPLIQENDVLATLRPLDSQDLLRTFKVTNDNAAFISVELARLFEYIGQGKGTLGAILKDTAMSNDLRVAIANTRNVSEQTQHIASDLIAVIQGMKSNGTLSGVLRDSTMGGRLNDIVNNLQSATDQSAKAMEQLNHFSEQINNPQGLVGSMTRDTAVTAEFVSALRNARESSENLNISMEALKHSIFFRRYFRKLEKQQKKEQPKTSTGSY